MANVVTYKVTGFMNEVIIVEFSMGGVKEVISFRFDGSTTIKAFLEQQAVFAMPQLKRKIEHPTPPDLNQYVGVTGTFDVPDLPVLPQPGAPPVQFSHTGGATMATAATPAKPAE